MPLTSDEISLIRINIGDDELVPVYSEDELNVYYDLAVAIYPDKSYVDVVTVYALRGILADAAKRVDYIQNESQENLSQRFRQIKALLDFWESKVGLNVPELGFGVINLGIDTDSLRNTDEWESWYMWYA